jgi:hypothetical protein
VSTIAPHRFIKYHFKGFPEDKRLEIRDEQVRRDRLTDADRHRHAGRGTKRRADEERGREGIQGETLREGRGEETERDERERARQWEKEACLPLSSLERLNPTHLPAAPVRFRV